LVAGELPFAVLALERLPLLFALDSVPARFGHFEDM
jgi:predicted tellurium resistance membrane protein TerC